MQTNYINGEWVTAANEATWTVVNPATEEMIAKVAFGGVVDAQAAVTAAMGAFPTWSNTNPWQRAEVLKKIADLMRLRAKDLAAITVSEAGKPLAEATGEWMVAAQFFEWFAEEGKRAYGRTIPASRNNKRMSVISQPIGVVGIITAWNFPVWNLARVWAAALAAGCTFVAKPSEYTPLTAIALMELLVEAGVPAGAANLVLGDAAAISSEWMEHPAVRKVHFVGSTRVGKLLLSAAAVTNTQLSLELGGNAPCLIFPNVDVEKLASSAALAKSRNAGQVCVSPQRFIVHESIYEQFCKLTAQHLRQLQLGEGLQPSVQMGPLINAKQRQHVADVVHNSVKQGAKLVTGGKIPEYLTQGFFYEPTLLKNVKPGHAIFEQEIFGPVMGVTSFHTTEEAIALANATEYGLAAYIWTDRLREAIHVSEALEFGIVGVNEWAAHATEAPFGGWKQSGVGYECGAEGLQEYLEKKLISFGDL